MAVLLQFVPHCTFTVSLIDKKFTMKKAFYLGLFVLLAFTALAQSDTLKIEQYCQIIATPKLLSNKVTIDIDFGEEKSVWRDTRLKTYDGRLKKFNSIIDALNFMGRDGWVFINAYPVRFNDTEIYHFAFKKTFTKSEMVAGTR
jgi:hypothetical protein